MFDKVPMTDPMGSKNATDSSLEVLSTVILPSCTSTTQVGAGVVSSSVGQNNVAWEL